MRVESDSEFAAVQTVGRDARSRSRPKSRIRSSKTIKSVLFAFVAIAGGFGIAMADVGIDEIKTILPADDLAIVAHGEGIYRSHCSSCHGSQLEGQPEWRMRDANGFLPAPPHNADGHTWHHADDLLFEIVKYGPGVVIGDETYKSAMPAYEGVLSDDDIVAALSFIKNSWPAEQRQWQDEINGTTESVDTPSSGETVLERLFK